MPRIHLGNDCCVWTAGGHPGRIEYPRAILDRIRELAVEGLFRSRHGGLEIGGVLFGTRQGQVIRVLDFRSVPCEHAFGPSFVLSEKDEAALGAILAEPPGSLEPLGWYQSHTRSGVFLSDREIQFVDQYFSKPWHIAMIVRPEPFGSARVGFFLRDAEGKLRTECTGEEFTASQPERGSPAPAAEKPGPAIPPPLVAAAPEVTPARPEAALPQRRRRKWAATALAAAACAVAAIGLYLSTRERPVALQAWDVGGQLRIEWDRRAGAVKNAESGALEIRDGSSRLQLPFDAEHLRRGSVTYVRHSANVDVRLRIYRRGAPVIEDFTRFVGQPAPETPAAPVPATLPVVEAANAASVAALRPVEPALPAVAPAPPEAKAPERSAPAKQPGKGVRPERELQRLRPPTPVPLKLPPPRPSPVRTPAAPPPALPHLTAMAGPLSAWPASPQQVQVPNPPPVVRSPAPRTEATPEPAKPVYNGPSSGRIIWTGQLGQGALLSIDGRHASTGFVNGELPGVPVRFSVHPAELNSKGLRVFSSDTRYLGDLAEQPGPRNGWNQTVYTWNPRRAREVIVLEAPGLQNGWKKLALRSESGAFAVILIDWYVVK